MEAWDVLHHETQINNDITLKTIQMCMLGFSAQSLQVCVQERLKVKHSNKAREAYERTPALQHYLVGLTVETGSGIMKDRTT